MVEVPSNIAVPQGFTLHRENTTSILLPDSKDAFLNPVQEFNRDMSIACITVWSEEFNAAKKAKWEAKKAKEPPRKKFKALDGGASSTSPSVSEKTQTEDINTHRAYRFTMIEPLSATGLRSIRFAKEIPLLKWVIANDLSSSAVESIKRNVNLNNVGVSGNTSDSDCSSGRVKIEKGDACTLMYSHRPEKNRVDCIDLDPYGSVSTFVDAAVQAVTEGGLLCVTCTDLAVLATNNYPEKCFANYGGVPVKSEYCHEVALRLILHLLSTTAARYGRYIHPLMSLSVDFYARIFVQVRSAPILVKRAISQTGVVYVCSFCQAYTIQALGQELEKVSASGNINTLYRQSSGPACGTACSECDSKQHIAGPMWIAPLHDKNFVEKVLHHVSSAMSSYGTSIRMKGMLTTVRDELAAPFYFTPAKVSSFFSCISPSLDEMGSALLHAGHQISRSHASAGSLKTSASRSDVYDIFRAWIESHPVVMKNITEHSPKQILLSKPASVPSNFDRHPGLSLIGSSEKVVRYQMNPAANWGPQAKAKSTHKTKQPE